MENTKQLTMARKLGYSTFNLGESIGYNMFYTYFLLFLTDFAGVAAGIAGTISLICVLWDGVTDAVIGYVSDRSKNPNGRRRPFVMRFFIPFGIMSALIFSDFGLTGAAQIVYYIIMTSLFWLCFTLTDVPAIALGGEITDEADEKRSIRSWSTVTNYIGYILASAFAPQLVAIFTPMVSNPSTAWTYTAIVFGIILVVCYAVSLVSTKGLEKPLSQEEIEAQPKGHFFKLMLGTLTIKPYRALWIYCIIGQIAVFIGQATLIYVIYYVCGGTDNDATRMFLLLGVFIIIASPIMDKFAQKVDNKKAIVVCITIQALGTIGLGVFGVSLKTLPILFVCVALGQAAYYVLSYTMVYDVSAVAYLKRNDGASTGTFIAFYQFAQKIGGAVGMWISGIALQLTGYDPNNITDSAINGIRIVATYINGGVALMAALAIFFLYTLRGEIYDKLVELTKKAPEELTEEDKALIKKSL